MKIDKIIFNKRNNLWYNGFPTRNSLSVKYAKHFIDIDGSNNILVSFRSMEEFEIKDKKKFTKRLNLILDKSQYLWNGEWTSEWTREQTLDGILYKTTINRLT